MQVRESRSGKAYAVKVSCSRKMAKFGVCGA